MNKKIEENQILEFVTLSQEGDTEAFAKLYDIFLTQIYRYIYFRADKADAEDLTELVFTKAFENIKSFRKSTFKFSSWLFRIAHNTVIDYYRGRREIIEISENLPDEKEENNPRLRAEKMMDKDYLKSALRSLNESQRQVIILKFVNDFSNREISTIMGKREGAIRILQLRALKNLRNILQEENIHY